MEIVQEKFPRKLRQAKLEGARRSKESLPNVPPGNDVVIQYRRRSRGAAPAVLSMGRAPHPIVVLLQLKE